MSRRASSRSENACPAMRSAKMPRTRSGRCSTGSRAASPAPSRATIIPSPTRIRGSSGARRPSRTTSRTRGPRSPAPRWFSPASRTKRKSAICGPTSGSSVPTATPSSVHAMIKDTVVNLSVGNSRDVAADYAVSVANAFGAHVAGTAFAYEPAIPGTVMGPLPAELIEASRAESRKAAKDAVARFDQAAGRAGVSFESRVVDATLVGGADLFGRIARRFDLSVVAQAEPDKAAGEDLIIDRKSDV